MRKRILHISSHAPDYPDVIAINNEATKQTPASTSRWFDVSNSALQVQVAVLQDRGAQRGQQLGLTRTGGKVDAAVLAHILRAD
ncbi:MAG: hypothetical protein ACK40S_07685 [Burkholderiaceae bacterium]